MNLNKYFVLCFLMLSILNCTEKPNKEPIQLPIIYRMTEFEDSIYKSDDMLYDYYRYLNGLEFQFISNQRVIVKKLEGNVEYSYSFLSDNVVLVGDTASKVFYKINYFGSNKSRVILFIRDSLNKAEQFNLTKMYDRVSDTIKSVNNIINRGLFSGSYKIENSSDTVFFEDSGLIKNDDEFQRYELAFGEYMEGGVPFVMLFDTTNTPYYAEFQRYERDFFIFGKNKSYVRISR